MASDDEGVFGPRVLLVRERTRVPLVAGSAIAALGLATAFDVAAHPPAGRLFARVLTSTPSAATGEGLWILFGGLLVALFGMAAAVGSAVTTPLRTRRRTVHATAGRLLVDGKPASRRVITGAAVIRTRRGPEVHVFDGAKGPCLIVGLGLEDEARHLADVLMAGEMQLAEFPFSAEGTRAGQVAGALLCLIVVLGGGVAYLLGVPTPLAIVIMLPAVVPLLIPVRASVGTDGLLVRWVGWKTFIPFAETERVWREAGRLMITLRDGKTLRLLGRTDAAGLDALLTRIQLARAAIVGRSAIQDLLAQGGRSAKDWRRALATLANPAYRHNALSKDHLWDLVADAGSEESARLGAAMILRVGLEEAGVERLRAITSASASPKLRVALEEIADSAHPLEETEAEPVRPIGAR